MREQTAVDHAALLTDFVRHQRYLAKSPQTIRLYRLAADKLLTTYSTVALDYLTAEHIERHLDSRPVGARTKAQELRYLRVFFRWVCEDKRLLKENPAARAKAPRWTSRRRPAPSFADFEAICRQCQTLEESVLIRMYFHTSLRLREVLRLRVRQVDLASREIRVITKGDEDRSVFFDPLQIPAHVALTPLLTAFLADRMPDAWVFPSPITLSHRSHEWVNRTMRRLGAQAGLPYRLTAHLLRHGWARWAKVSGVPLPIAQKQLGHKDIRTTDRLYGAVDSTDQRKALDEYLRPPS